jgi:hypothetical protein
VRPKVASVDNVSLTKNGRTSCKHDYPIVVSAIESGGKRAQCLGCKKLGPEGVDAEQARQRLIGLPKPRAGAEARRTLRQ